MDLSDRTRERWQVLDCIIKAYALKFGAEIGVDRCATSKYVLGSNSGLRLILVDKWDGDVDPHQARNTVSEFQDRVRFLIGDSVEMANSVTDQSLDFFFLDADHTHEKVAADLKAWLPKLKPGGFAVGHDYSASHPGVISALRETLVQISKRTVISLHPCASVWWFRSV